MIYRKAVNRNSLHVELMLCFDAAEGTYLLIILGGIILKLNLGMWLGKGKQRFCHRGKAHGPVMYVSQANNMLFLGSTDDRGRYRHLTQSDLN